MTGNVEVMGFGFLQTFLLKMCVSGFCFNLLPVSSELKAGVLFFGEMEQSTSLNACKSILLHHWLFAYTEHNESLIRCCHLQPTVSHSRINSWSSWAEKEQRRAAALSLLFVSVHMTNHRSTELVDRVGVFLTALSRCALWCILFGTCFAFL